MSASELAHWVMRARRAVPRADRRVLLSPPRLVARFARFAWHRADGRTRGVPADDVLARDPGLIEVLLDLLRPLAHSYFRLRVEGIEHVPAEGPVLLVGNHSGGLVPMEGLFTVLAIDDHLGPRRAVYTLAHDFLFDDPILRRYASRLGILRAGHESARHAFGAGAAVLVYPGSDLDNFRRFRDRHRIVLGERKGFVRLALRERVPIVPVVSVGTHEQLFVLVRGERLARLLRAHFWARTEVFPIVAALPWGITSGFVPYWPLPAQTTVSFLPPIAWPEIPSEAADDAETIEDCYREVEAAMQTELDRLARGRRWLRGA
jgi:1-acyl-sn-glycerol-3-phosphate acyltransferase